MTSMRVLEQVTVLHPLGLRFWDEVSAGFATGLAVSAYPAGNSDLRMSAALNRTNVYSFHGLPGLPDIERGAGDDPFWSSNPPRFFFTIEVQDPEERFLPFQWTLQLPQRGIYTFPGSRADVAASVPLFSAPSRPVATSLAVIRAELFDALNNVPASWAVVDALVGELPPARGIADDRGRVVIVTPYPEPRNTVLGSPPPAAGPRIDQQTWPVSIEVRYTAAVEPGLPDLLRLFHQGPAIAWADDALLDPFPTATLAFGRELILRSRRLSGSPPAPMPMLLITPAGSPP